MPHHLNSFKLRHQDEPNTAELDKRLLELSALFEISQTLNSSLNLKAILDNILLVPMGRMMISKGIILFQHEPHQYKIENLKGLPFSLIGKEIHITNAPDYPVLISELDTEDEWLDFFRNFKINLLLPLTSKRNFKGLIGFSGKLIGERYSDDEIEFLSSLGNIAVQSIENALIFDELNQVNRELDQKVQELNTLFEIGKELNQIFDQQNILKQLSYSLMGQMLVNQFIVALKNDDHFETAFKKGSLFNDKNLAVCLKFCGQIPELANPLMLTGEDKFKALYEIGVRIIVPMDIQNKIGGFIFLGEKLDESQFTKSNLDFLSTLSNMAMISIENARLFQETLEKQRLEEELNLAKSIQSKLLPAQMPQITGYDVHGFNFPSKQVGGDYFDVIQLNDNEYILTIADVSGKGMPASLLMSNLQAGLQTLCTERYPLNEMTAKLNNLIYKNTSIERYITYFMLKLNIQSGSIEYVNAGHNPPYLFSADGSYKTLDKGGIILGMMPNIQYETGYVEIKPGDCLTMFTDGVTEAMDDKDNEFEECRVIEFFEKFAAKYSSKELNMRLFEALTDFAGDPTQYDDVTILTVKKI
ncbi:MAG: SpoIIE family protein phosphatase [Calditrichales bacterium]|nr:SpoIIE family protein phosphatase [Calditrichales bacterium]